MNYNMKIYCHFCMLNSTQLFARDKTTMNYLATMATTTWSCIGHIIMSNLSCHIYKGHLIKMHPYRVSIVLITCSSPLTAIISCQVSLNPMAVPKPISLHLKGRPQRTFSKKLTQIKTSAFERAKVKVH